MKTAGNTVSAIVPRCHSCCLVCVGVRVMLGSVQLLAVYETQFRMVVCVPFHRRMPPAMVFGD